MVLLTFCLQYPGSRWAIVRKSFARLLDTTIPSWAAFVQANDLKWLIKEQTKSRVVFSNGSEIIFFHESIHADPELNRFKGLEVNGFLLEEMNELSQATFEKCIERAGSWFHSKAPTKILATCNPTDNWVKDMFYTPHKTRTLPKHLKYIASKISDNKSTPAGYLERLRESMTTNNYARFVDGDWDVVTDGLIKSAWFGQISWPELCTKPFFGELIWHSYLDGAYTDKTTGDPSALVIAAQYKGTLFVRYAIAKHLESADVLEWATGIINAHGKTAASLLKIEPKASGKTLVQLARRTTGDNYIAAVEYTPPKASKITLNSSKFERVSACTSFIAAGRVVLVNGPWNQDFIRECANFPNAEHDDRLDCLTFAILEAQFPEKTFSITHKK